ncbi:MAG: hypothetical protein A2W31_02625 [Planctomycetes bacterium RBG_16_64_10]|nr:MAG: hypothetical protein A2W31_02625 [Planctomycetes bacterium RBG_16_64_10]
MACVAVLAVPALAEQNVFFSTIGAVGGGVVVGDPVIDATAGDLLTLYIWSSDDQDYNTSIGMNVVPDVPGAVNFTGAAVYNPDLMTGFGFPLGKRWSEVGVGGIGPAVTKMNAVFVTTTPTGSEGVTSNNDGTVPPLLLQDPLYDEAAGAFLLGEVRLDVLPSFAAPVVLSINQDGTALFVHNGQQVLPNFGIATLIPEPSTIVLAVLGLIALVGYRRR